MIIAAFGQLIGKHQNGWTICQWIDILNLKTDYWLFAKQDCIKFTHRYYFHKFPWEYLLLPIFRWQITFENTESPSGFFVVHNDHRFLECKSSESSSNSCFTSRVVYLNSGDQIHLSDMFADQRVVLIEGQSFFGLMKLGPGQ